MKGLKETKIESNYVGEIFIQFQERLSEHNHFILDMKIENNNTI